MENVSDIEKLKQSLAILNKNISEFPIGAITLDDYKPIEEKIQDLRVSLKCMSSRLQMLQINMNLDKSESLSTSYTPETYAEAIEQIDVKLSQSIINNHTSKFCLYSKGSQDIFFSNNIDSEIQSQLKAIMKKLFIINDKMVTWQNHIDELSDKEIKLKDECGQYIVEFQNFLKEQENIRHRILEQSNPEIAEKKERVKQLVYKINLMKRLITNFISAASSNIKTSPELEIMLKRHRDLVSIDTIMEMEKNPINNRED